MAITIINTQGIEISANAKVLECPQIMGDLDEQREETEYGCLSTDDVYVALGKITRAPFTMQALYKPEGVDGQAELDTAFYDIDEIPIKLELSDADTSVGEVGAVGTLLEFNAMVKGRKQGFPNNGAVTMDYTLKIVGTITKTPMVAGSAT